MPIHRDMRWPVRCARRSRADADGTSRTGGRPGAPGGGRWREARGSTLVEAAIVLPLLFMLLFGILEYGLLFRTGLTISDATRAGARVAVARPRSPEYHTAAAAAVSGALATSGIPSDQIGLLVVYRADPRTGGLKGGGDSDAAIEGCASNCWKFTWDPAQREYVVHGSTTWPAENQYACGIEAETDYLGVYVRASHQFITGFFRDQQPVTERTVMRLEPLPLSDECKPAAG